VVLGYAMTGLAANAILLVRQTQVFGLVVDVADITVRVVGRLDRVVLVNSGDLSLGVTTDHDNGSE